LTVQAGEEELVKLLGSLKFRHSYTQNVLHHSIEVAQLTGLLASELGLEGLAFPLDDRAALDAALRRAPVVLHCAGPYVRTYRPMAESACEPGRTT
jgi:short subunit dehydrogenase-like uncharacterized protein